MGIQCVRRPLQLLGGGIAGCGKVGQGIRHLTGYTVGVFDITLDHVIHLIQGIEPQSDIGGMCHGDSAEHGPLIGYQVVVDIHAIVAEGLQQRLTVLGRGNQAAASPVIRGIDKQGFRQLVTGVGFLPQFCQLLCVIAVLFLQACHASSSEMPGR